MKTIPFTSEVPKVPGAYWWKESENDEPQLIQLIKFAGVIHQVVAHRAYDAPRFGLWSPPLIPSSTLKTAEEAAYRRGFNAGHTLNPDNDEFKTAVKEAFEEGYRHGYNTLSRRDHFWLQSNARKIVEGENI